MVLKPLAQGKAAFKAFVADHADINIASMPADNEVLALLQRERERDRPIYLASASDHRHVQVVADRLGLFHDAFGSTPDRNLACPAKANFLCSLFGEKEI